MSANKPAQHPVLHRTFWFADLLDALPQISFVCFVRRLDLLFTMTGVSEGNVDEPFLVECNGIEDKGKVTSDSRDKDGWENLLPLLEKWKYSG